MQRFGSHHEIMGTPDMYQNNQMPAAIDNTYGG